MTPETRPYWVCLRASSPDRPYLIGVTFAASARDAGSRMLPGAYVMPCELSSRDVLDRVPADLEPLAVFRMEVAKLPSWRDAHAAKDLSSASYCEREGIDWS